MRCKKAHRWSQCTLNYLFQSRLYLRRAISPQPPRGARRARRSAARSAQPPAGGARPATAFRSAASPLPVRAENMVGAGLGVAARLARGNALFSSARPDRPWRDASGAGPARGTGAALALAAAPGARGLGRGRGGAGRRGWARGRSLRPALQVILGELVLFLTFIARFGS